MLYGSVATGKESARAAGGALHGSILAAFPTLPSTEPTWQRPKTLLMEWRK